VTGLKRRTRLVTRTRLRRTTVLRRTTALKARRQLAVTRSEPAVPADVRDALVCRSGGLCEIGRPGCTRWACDPHHRVLRGAGGCHGEAKTQSDRLANLLLVCRPCHSWVHGGNNRKAAEAHGWIVRRGTDPAFVPVLYRDELFYIADIGGRYPYEAVGA
jgi:hypothetical protein